MTANATGDVLAEVRRHPQGITARALIDSMEARGPHTRRALQSGIHAAVDAGHVKLGSNLELVPTALIHKEQP